MKQEYRINGGLVNRSKPINFTFNNKQMTGYEGDTLASALLANGQRLVGRSFKYHRPRGIFSSGSEEPNALVQLRSGAHQEPNTRATVVELCPWMAHHLLIKQELKVYILTVDGVMADLKPHQLLGIVMLTYLQLIHLTRMLVRCD